MELLPGHGLLRQTQLFDQGADLVCLLCHRLAEFIGRAGGHGETLLFNLLDQDRIAAGLGEGRIQLGNDGRRRARRGRHAKPIGHAHVAKPGLLQSRCIRGRF